MSAHSHSFRRRTRAPLLLAAAALALSLTVPAQAQERTAQGHVSVAMLADMISRSANNSGARERLSLYLTGIGESTGHLISMAGDSGIAVDCAGSFSLGSDTAWAAIMMAAPDRSTWAQTPAAPIILMDMLERAGCR